MVLGAEGVQFGKHLYTLHEHFESRRVFQRPLYLCVVCDTLGALHCTVLLFECMITRSHSPFHLRHVRCINCLSCICLCQQQYPNNRQQVCGLHGRLLSPQLETSCHQLQGKSVILSFGCTYWIVDVWDNVFCLIHSSFSSQYFAFGLWHNHAELTRASA